VSDSLYLWTDNINVKGFALQDTSSTNSTLAKINQKQNLTQTNIPVTLPLIRGYFGGSEVFYITTETSDKQVADHLTNITGSRVAYAPSLRNSPPQSTSNIYEFKNGVKGTGPEGFQPNVADSQPGDLQYSPLWRINLVEWKHSATPRELRSESEILDAQKTGELTITPTDIVVNCPFIQWNGGSLPIRENKTLTDESAYGGGQVLNIDTTNKMQVTFVGHRGFAPDGSTIYYIATDASVIQVAQDLGVIFVNKTGATLQSGASSDLYVFTNGIKGTGPMGFQASIASTNVGDAGYSPLWRIQAVSWKDPSQAEFLTKAEQIISSGSEGSLGIKIAGVIVNCPFVDVDGNIPGNAYKVSSKTTTSTAADGTSIFAPNQTARMPDFSIVDNQSATVRSATGNHISIVQNAPSQGDKAFNPSLAHIKIGDTLTWTNNDGTVHTVTSGSSNDTSKQGKDFNSPLISPSGTFEHTFKEARNYDYFCRLHPWMIGQLIVEPK
jgi:plastocyanin